MSLRQVNVGRGDIAISIFLNFAGLFNKGGTTLIYGPKAHIFFFPSFLHPFFPSFFSVFYLYIEEVVILVNEGSI